MLLLWPGSFAWPHNISTAVMYLLTTDNIIVIANYPILNHSAVVFDGEADAFSCFGLIRVTNCRYLGNFVTRCTILRFTGTRPAHNA